MAHVRCLALVALVAISPGLIAQGFRYTSWINGLEHDGQQITCDLPEREQMANIGSFVDSYGMCVTTSIEMAARYQGIEEMRGFRDWAARQPGGGYPSKVDRQLGEWFRLKNLDPKKFPYMQIESNNPSELEKALSLIDKTGRLGCITYGYSPRYRGSIAHMVCCVSFQKYGVVLDNNYVSRKRPDDSWNNNIFEWMGKEELLRRIRHGGGGWIFVWLTSPPAPIPRN